MDYSEVRAAMEMPSDELPAATGSFISTGTCRNLPTTLAVKEYGIGERSLGKLFLIDLE